MIEVILCGVRRSHTQRFLRCQQTLLSLASRHRLPRSPRPCWTFERVANPAPLAHLMAEHPKAMAKEEQSFDYGGHFGNSYLDGDDNRAVRNNDNSRESPAHAQDNQLLSPAHRQSGKYVSGLVLKRTTCSLFKSMLMHPTPLSKEKSTKSGNW